MAHVSSCGGCRTAGSVSESGMCGIEGHQVGFTTGSRCTQATYADTSHLRCACTPRFWAEIVEKVADFAPILWLVVLSD